MNMTYKIACAIALYVLWAILVIALKLNPAELIDAIKYGLMAVGGWLGVTQLQAVPASELNGIPAPDPRMVQTPGGAPKGLTFPDQK